MKALRVAVVDVGTNTVLYLLMTRTGEGALVVDDEEVVPTRLGEGLGKGGPSAAAVERTAVAVGRLVARARAAGVNDVIILGTEVLRQPPWREAFQRVLRRKTGLTASVLSHQAEGELVLAAVRRSLPLGPEPVAAVDVGGGSVQIIREREAGRGGEVEVTSYPLGCVVLTERFLRGGEDREWEEARSYVQGALAREGPAPAGDVVVTGGTAAAAVTLQEGWPAYDRERVHGARIRLTALEELARAVYRLDAASRRRLPGMPAGRADVLPAGALVLAAVLRRLGRDDALVSAQGVRFGAAYKYLAGERPL